METGTLKTRNLSPMCVIAATFCMSIVLLSGNKSTIFIAGEISGQRRWFCRFVVDKDVEFLDLKFSLKVFLLSLHD